LEIANVIAKSEARGLLQENRTQAFLSALDAAPIFCDLLTHAKSLAETLQLDEERRRAARKAGRQTLQGPVTKVCSFKSCRDVERGIAAGQSQEN
jgi:hypothetical protein